MISSFLVKGEPDAQGHVFLVFDTVIDGKHVFTACGVGKVERGEPLLTPVAQRTLMALGDYSQMDGAGDFRLVEIATIPAVTARLSKALAAANGKDAVFFICRSPHVYDAAVAALNPDYTASTQQQ